MIENDQISLTDCVYFPSYSVNCISCFTLSTFDGVMTFGYLKSKNVIISRTKRAIEVK